MLYLRVAAVLILGLLGVAPVWTQQDSCQTRTVPVSIMSGDSSPLPDINDAAFEGSYRGKSVRINSVAIDQRPRRVLLLLDASASFTDKLDWAFDVADDMLEHIPLPTEIGLASFAQTVETVVPPTTDRTTIRNDVLIRLAPLGTTACRSWVAAGSPVPEASGRRPSVFGGD